MTVRLTCDVNNTTKLLEQIMVNLNQGNRVMFLVDAGRGKKFESRIRVKLSRIRKAMEKKGRKRRHFTLVVDVYPWTEGGLRYDCMTVYGVQNDTHKATELLEDLMGHGRKI